MSQQKLQDKEKCFRDLFNSLDASGDGVLTIQELKHGLKANFGADVSDQDAVEMFMGIDSSGDKKCTCQEFVKEMCRAPRKEAYEEQFKNSDSDGSGKLDRGEVQRLCQSVAAEGVTDEDIEAMLNAVDTNNDGVIDYNEFMALC